MTTKPLITADEANSIQAEWMKLDSNASEKEKNRVFALMKKLPTSHISQDKHGQGQVMMQGLPIHDRPMLIDQAVAYAYRAGVQTILRWNASGVWTNEERGEQLMSILARYLQNAKFEEL